MRLQPLINSPCVLKSLHVTGGIHSSCVYSCVQAIYKMNFEEKKTKDQHVQKPIYNSSTTDFILLCRL